MLRAIGQLDDLGNVTPRNRIAFSGLCVTSLRQRSSHLGEVRTTMGKHKDRTLSRLAEKPGKHILALGDGSRRVRWKRSLTRSNKGRDLPERAERGQAICCQQRCLTLADSKTAPPPHAHGSRSAAVDFPFRKSGRQLRKSSSSLTSSVQAHDLIVDGGK